MKKRFLSVWAILWALSALSCATKEHWAGVYTGVIPSAGGEGIDVKVTLNANETYKVETRYIGKSNEVFTNAGKFTWNSERNIVILPNEREDLPPSYYKLGQKALIHLDIAGNVITGELANDYILMKQ
ncbi:MAG: copper resistance protein NlpE [Treponema sp.]|nr:copper resistance protein NlpE [Treponema sp.]